MQKFFTVAMVSEMFRKHPNTVYRWILTDKLFPNASRVGDGWLVPQSDIRRVLKAGRVDRRAAAPLDADAAILVTHLS